MDIEAILSKLPESEQAAFLMVAEEYMSSLKREKSQGDFMSFVQQMARLY